MVRLKWSIIVEIICLNVLILLGDNISVINMFFKLFLFVVNGVW